MSSKDDGGPAFPVSGGIVLAGGMSLRDWFAGQALAGIVAGCNSNADRARALATDADERGETIAANTAGQAYELADAMLAERSK